MQPIRKILVAIKNPDARSQPGAVKAMHLARALGASLEFFHAISDTVLLEVAPLTGTSLAEIRREALALRGKRIDKLVARARKLGLQARGSAVWDYPPYEAIVRRARAVGADLILAECHQGRRLQPWLMRLTDWELLRLSPVPVLLLRSTRRWRQAPNIVASVDPLHANDKPAALDDRIVEAAGMLADRFQGEVTLVHASYPPVQSFVLADPIAGGATLADLYESHKQYSAGEFAKFANRHHVPPGQRRLIDAQPAYAIPQVARELRADVVVMGAVSRSGLKRVFIGNTAERVLAALPCDVLVIKPARAAVRRKVADRPRGMRVTTLTGAVLPA